MCDVVNSICDVICKRSEADKNYGVVLIPEGLIDFIPEVRPAALDKDGDHGSRCVGVTRSPKQTKARMD